MEFIFDHFLGTIVNFVSVLALGMLGSLIKKSIPERFSDSIMSAIGVCVIYIGIDGALEAAPTVPEGSFLSAGLFKVLVMILSLAIGAVLGELINIDKWLNLLGDRLAARFSGVGKGDSLAKGFVSCSLLFCVGAMTINGALLDAQGDPSILLAKSVIDSIAVFLMAGSMGAGCAFSAFFLLIYQGAITALGIGLVSLLSASTLTYISVTGSLVIILVGTNVLGITKVRTANLIPALFMPIAVEALLRVIFC